MSLVSFLSNNHFTNILLTAQLLGSKQLGNNKQICTYQKVYHRHQSVIELRERPLRTFDFWDGWLVRQKGTKWDKVGWLVDLKGTYDFSVNNQGNYTRFPALRLFIRKL